MVCRAASLKAADRPNSGLRRGAAASRKHFPPALFPRAVAAISTHHPARRDRKIHTSAARDLHALLNEGHCAGGTVLRVLGEKLELREFGIFVGAVAFARNGRLPDDLEQR